MSISDPLPLSHFERRFFVIIAKKKAEFGRSNGRQPPAHAAPPFWPPLFEAVAVLSLAETSNPHHHSSRYPNESRA